MYNNIVQFLLLVMCFILCVYFHVQNKPIKVKGLISRLKDCRVKYKDPSEKMTDKQFILVDDNGTVYTNTHPAVHTLAHTHTCACNIETDMAYYLHNHVYSGEFPNFQTPLCNGKLSKNKG